MIYTNYQYNSLKILGSFLIVNVLQIIPYPLQLYDLPKPSWINLLLIYWITKSPNQFNIGTGFLTGLITDIITGPILGIRAAILSIITYMIIIKFPLLHHYTLWRQGIIIGLLSFSVHTAIHLSNLTSTNKIKFFYEMLITPILFSSIIDIFVWIAIFLTMNNIHVYYKVKKKKFTFNKK